MKNTILISLTLLFIIGCNGTKPSPKNDSIRKVKNTKPSEEYERTVSYQDIIMKINDINTNKKTNKRVKNIVKEYQYNVGDDDSKNSARKKALTQVKVLILEEIGVFVESYLELNSVIEDKKYQKYFKEEIKNLTAGILKTKILDEKFDGKTYYVKASVLVDPDSVSEGISEILKIKANKSEINKLTKLLKTKEQEIDMRSTETITLQKKITKQELLNRAKEQELQNVKFKLQQVRQQLLRYKQEEVNLNTELGRIQTQVQQAMQRIQNKAKKACMMKIGMTEQEVVNILGQPDGKAYCDQEIRPKCDLKYVYGSVSLYFPSDIKILEYVIGCN